MAIRPVDLQLAYMAAPLVAAEAAATQNAPNVAQQAAAATFAAQVREREETVDEADHVVGNRVKSDTEREGGADWSGAQEQQARKRPSESTDEPPTVSDGTLHFIDTVA